MKSVIATAAICMIAGSAQAAVSIGTAVSENAANDNFLTEIIASLDLPYDGNAMLTQWFGGDMFGITSRPLAAATVNGMPFAMNDDSAGTFTADNQGIIDTGDLGRFFGAVDTVNGSEADGTGVARWTFSTGGFSNLSVDIDFAAMGDFEASDLYNFEYSYDMGVNYVPLFTSSVDELGAKNYTMEGGAVFNLFDPLSMNGTELDNNFQTISAGTTGAGAEFWIRFTGTTNGGTEAYAFRNINVIPTPGTIALFGLAGVAGVRRRRA